jgi:DNA repair protein RecN (Recombination protein N)
MIFDEVDAGIGGEVAVEVGRRLAQLAERVQVIVVTHLPQVAAFAQNHFVVNKNEGKLATTTAVTEVTGEARTREITRMLSGLPDSISGAIHAEELISLAQK